VEVSASSGNLSAYLPVSLAPDSGIWTFTLTLNTVNNNSNWVGFGFATGTSGIDSSYYSDSMGTASYWSKSVIGLLGGTTYFTSSNDTNRISNVITTSSPGVTPLTISVILDTYKTTDNIKIETHNAEGAEAVRSISGTLTRDQINSITAIKFGIQGAASGGKFDDLSLTLTTITPIPEAGTTAASIAFSILGMAIVIRRRTIP
jgi:hypothetical protein